jgi:hypothetical protein
VQREEVERAGDARQRLAAQRTRSAPSPNSRKPISPRASVTLASIISMQVRAAAPLSSQGSSEDGSDIVGQRSSSVTARGASSAKCSRTMNSSMP